MLKYRAQLRETHTADLGVLIVPMLRRGNANPTAPAVIDAERQGRRSYAGASMPLVKYIEREISP